MVVLTVAVLMAAIVAATVARDRLRVLAVADVRLPAMVVVAGIRRRAATEAERPTAVADHRTVAADRTAAAVVAADMGGNARLGFLSA